MQELQLETKQRTYPIYISSDLFKNIQLVSDCLVGDKVLILSSQPIAEHYLDAISLLLADKTVHHFLIADGESEKNLTNYTAILDYLILHKFKRNDCLIALGGGVIGDLGGFVAASYQRGMRLLQMPTSLLAQVDSSVGGKTAINHASGKNLIGAFYQPYAVFIDLNSLKTLPQREYISGLAEVIKYAFLGEDKILQLLTNNKEQIMQRQDGILEQIIYLSCAKKAEVVAKDETETGSRALLNLGHTFAHAIEKITNYQQYLHGEAVAIGMLMAINLSSFKVMISKEIADQYRDLIASYGLPQTTPFCQNAMQMLDVMQLDKKNLNDNYRLILPTDNSCVIVEENDHELISQAIDMQLTSAYEP